MPDRRTRKGVEIARVGTYRLSTGEHTFTKKQLASAAANAQTFTPRIGIGHIDPRFNQADHDGDPAFGKAVNLTLAEDGDVLLADLDGMAPWLDENLDVAYPGRSLEAKVRGDDMRITAVKLLGTTEPGITTLKDLQTAIAASVQAGDTSAEEQEIAVRTLRAAGVNTDDIRRAWDSEHQPADAEKATDADWWWVQEVRIDPDELIVRNGQDLYRVPWTATADGTFTFGDRVKVVVQYVDVAAASGEHVVYQAPVTRPTPTPKEESTVDPKILREQLGLAEDASEEDVTAKLTELHARPTETQVSEQVAAKAEELAAEKIAASAAADGETVKLDPAAYEELKASATLGKQAHERQQTDDRERFIAAAIGDGKFPPSRREHYVGLMERDPDGTREFIDGLEKNVVPVEETGVAASSSDDEIETLDALFPQLQTQEA